MSRIDFCRAQDGAAPPRAPTKDAKVRKIQCFVWECILDALWYCFFGDALKGLKRPRLLTSKSPKIELNTRPEFDLESFLIFVSRRIVLNHWLSL